MDLSDKAVASLLECTYKNTPALFFGYETWAVPVKVYDGDTIHFAFYMGDSIYRQCVRLNGIDTAEMHSDDPQEEEHAKKAKDRITQLMGNNLVYLKCTKLGKYGRLLADVYKTPNDEKSLNQILIDEGLAYEYHGEGKKPFREWHQV